MILILNIKKEAFTPLPLINSCRYHQCNYLFMVVLPRYLFKFVKFQLLIMHKYAYTSIRIMKTFFKAVICIVVLKYLQFIVYRYTINKTGVHALIQSFKCKDTEILFTTGKNKRWSSLTKVVTRKLMMLHAAATLEFLKSPPGNRLEALSGNREGQYSIRINNQWRICFEWTTDGPANVEIVDYH